MPVVIAHRPKKRAKPVPIKPERCNLPFATQLGSIRGRGGVIQALRQCSFAAKRKNRRQATMRSSLAIALGAACLTQASGGAWQRAVAAITLTSTLRPVRGAWQARGKMEFLWATPVMEYDGLFNEVDCGVPWPSGGLTPSTRLASIRRARGSSRF